MKLLQQEDTEKKTISHMLNYYLMKSYEISNYLLSTNAENIFDSRFLASSKHIITSQFVLSWILTQI